MHILRREEKQVLLLSEFGNMFASADQVAFHSGVSQPTGKVYSTHDVFEHLLKDVDLPHIHIVAAPPYVALIDTNCWGVKEHHVLEYGRRGIECSKPGIKIQHLILEHVETLETFRCFNAHIPVKILTPERKEDCVRNMCDMATGTGVTQLSAAMPWMICRDVNLWRSQGIPLVPVQSWVGWHNKPCASDVHDAVVVTGAFECRREESVFTKAPLSESVWAKTPPVLSHNSSSSSGGVSQPTATVLKDSMEETRQAHVRDIVSIDDNIPQTTVTSTTCDVPQQTGTNAEADAPDNSCVLQPAADQA